MKQSESNYKLGGIFYIKHYRNDKLLHESSFDNIFVNEGLVYGLNSAFAVSVGGAPTPLTNMYIGLTTANRLWQGTDKADDTVSGGIHTVGLEFEGYTVAADNTVRPTWLPQALSTTSNIELSDSGAEATFDITADATLEGAFLISTNLKNGTLDIATAILLAGSNFTTGPRSVFIGDVFKVGYVLQAGTVA